MTRIALAALALTACKTDPDDQTPDAPTWDEVGPIVEARCTGCHNDAGAAPFSLTTYAEAQARADLLAMSVESRVMPPWLVTDDGTCGEFAHSWALSPEEVETITSWAAGGAAKGAGADLAVAAAPTIQQVDMELVTPSFVPEPEGSFFAEDDEYRCFVFDNPLGRDAHITASEAFPGNASIVHHVLAMPVDPDGTSWAGNTTNAQEIAAMDGADGRPGWDCLGTAGGNIRERGIPVTWAPGQGVVAYPDGVGVWVGGGDKIVVQVHYNFPDPSLEGQSDSTAVRFTMADQVEKPATVVLIDPFIESIYNGSPDTLDPGKPDVRYTWEISGFEVLDRAGLSRAEGADGFKLYGVMPHMHQQGTAFDFTIVRDGSPNECAAEITRWDFGWQMLYFYQEPITVKPEDAFKVKCRYDTSAMLNPVLPGWGTNYEMCLLAAVVGL